MTQTSIATVSLSGTLDEKLRAIAGAGFDGVEIFEADFLAFSGQARDVGKMVRDFGLKLFAFQPLRDFEGMPEPYRARNFIRAERKFDLIQEMGTDLLLICSNVSPHSVGGIDRSADDLRELGERAASRGVRVGFEALAWGKHVSDYRDAWEIVRRANHSSIGLVLDSFHTLAPQLPVDAIRAIPADKIFIVQLADAPKLNLDILSWSRHFRCFPGQGDLPVGVFMQAVKATGYDGPLSLEIFNDQFRAGSAGRSAKDGLRSLILLEDQLNGVDAPTTSRKTSMVPKSPCRGVEFIEFAMTPEIATELRKIFVALGFRHTGQHHSKAVERWSQGDINLVINTETEGFAHSHYITHGAGVCAIGLKVDDVHETMSRAALMKAQSFRQKVDAGELEIPAIHGVGGSLLYFIDRKGPLAQVWQQEFTDIATSDLAIGKPLNVVDHISQSMHYDEMLSWTLFYTSIFDLTRVSHLEIPDPSGLVQSQVIETKDSALRLVLNTSTGSRTQSSRFLNEFFGAGVQHIAFSTDDIFSAARHMRDAGMTFLSIPENYYDDIEARFDVSPDIMKQLREFGILYDRDGDAEFFQIYTHEIAGRFFFEIVERRAYRGYGAANAPIRLAAQTLEARRSSYREF